MSRNSVELADIETKKRAPGRIVIFGPCLLADDGTWHDGVTTHLDREKWAGSVSALCSNNKK